MCSAFLSSAAEIAVATCSGSLAVLVLGALARLSGRAAGFAGLRPVGLRVVVFRRAVLDVRARVALAVRVVRVVREDAARLRGRRSVAMGLRAIQPVFVDVCRHGIRHEACDRRSPGNARAHVGR